MGRSRGQPRGGGPEQFRRLPHGTAPRLAAQTPRDGLIPAPSRRGEGVRPRRRCAWLRPSCVCHAPGKGPAFECPLAEGQGLWQGNGNGDGQEEGREEGLGKSRDKIFRQAGLGPPHSTPWLPLPNASLLAGLLVAARPSATAWGRPDTQGTRLFGQSCPRPAGQRASQEPGSAGLPEGVEYIPTRKKGKNPMKPVGVAW